MAKKMFSPVILFITFYLGLSTAYSDNQIDFQNCSVVASSYDLCGDVLYKSDSGGRTELYDKVAAISIDKGTTYYIRSSGEKWIVGFFRENSEVSSEFDLPGKYEKLYRFAGSNNIFYYLVQPVKNNAEEKPENNPVFIRFNPDQMSFQNIVGVSDFILVDGKSVVLRNNSLYYNGTLIQVLLPGKLKILNVIDSRIALISDTTGTELVDLLAEKSIYQYKENSVPAYPAEYNLILELGDIAAQNETNSSEISSSGISLNTGSSIYYEILIDGEGENRTEIGMRELIKTFNANLVPGRYHIIKPERWELDKTKGRYTRMNNVYQPAELKIFIPENRILKIKIEFNGTDYSISQSVLFK